MKKNVNNILLVINIILLLVNLLCIIGNGRWDSYNCIDKIILPNTSNNTINYEYKIEGIDENWSKCQCNEINLDNLPYGNYNVAIRGILSDGSIKSYNKSHVCINPPFWLTKNAVMIYLCIILVVIIYKKKKTLKINNLIESRTKFLLDKLHKNSSLLNKAVESEKIKSCYFVNMSHELRTPINVISSTCQLVMELNNNNGINKENLEHYMSICRKNSMHLLEIINDIIDIAKMKSNNFPLNIDKHDIVSVVENSAFTLKDYVEKKGIEMIIDPEIEEKYIECDKKQIERCIVNLVGNAFKFTSPGGLIQIFIKDHGDKVQIEVQDNGKGIAKENHKSIFNRFNQVKNSNSSVNKGSGLGLTITKQIIEEHNGSIKVESELGKGSNFIVILPVNHISQV